MYRLKSIVNSRVLNSFRKQGYKFSIILVLILLIIFALWAYSDITTKSRMARNSVLDYEVDTSRLEKVFTKAMNGLPVTIAVIGGSITEGARATTKERQWSNLLVKWFSARFPKSEVNLINAGIGSTGSLYGVHRIDQDVLSHEPDIVVVEFAVNDGASMQYSGVMEGLVRKILMSSNNVAAIMLFMSQHKGKNVQEWHSTIGAHYRLPMISYRDAIWPEITNGKIEWSDVSADKVHPNDDGHKLIANLLMSYLESVQRKMPYDKHVEISKLPDPLLTDIYETARILKTTQLEPVYNSGWVQNESGWYADKSGSVISFIVKGTHLALRYWRVKGGSGVTEVTVDKENSTHLDAYTDADFDYVDAKTISGNLSPGEHLVEIRLTDKVSHNNTGNYFQLHEILSAGNR